MREELLVGGEFLHILRPTAYAILRQRSDENSWLPVVVAFILEASGYVTGDSESITCASLDS